MKTLLTILVLVLMTTAIQAQGKTVTTLRDSATIAKDSVNVGPLNFNYTWALTAEFYELDDVDAYIHVFGGMTATGPWIPTDTLVMADTAYNSAGIKGEDMHYLYYKYLTVLESVTGGGMELKLLRGSK